MHSVMQTERLFSRQLDQSMALKVNEMNPARMRTVEEIIEKAQSKVDHLHGGSSRRGSYCPTQRYKYSQSEIINQKEADHTSWQALLKKRRKTVVEPPKPQSKESNRESS